MFYRTGGYPAPVLQLIEQSLDQVAPTIFGTVMRDGVAAVALGRDYRFHACGSDLHADRIGIVAPIGQEGLDPIGDHAEEWCEALHIVCLPRGQHEAEREASGIASGVELGSEASARSAKGLRLPSPLFMPTAQ